MFEVLFTAVGIIFIVAIVIPVFLIYTAYNFVVDLTLWSFIAEYWLAILGGLCLIAFLISVIPVKRVEQEKFLTLSGDVLTRRNYFYLVINLSLISFIIYMIRLI